ncbi:MAG: hypothetical protein EXR67_03480 [Dehalococcoidia bacterium]|nr:hypothetical protein [Dehalococcoidia bacterium]
MKTKLVLGVACAILIMGLLALLRWLPYSPTSVRAVPIATPAAVSPSSSAVAFPATWKATLNIHGWPGQPTSPASKEAVGPNAAYVTWSVTNSGEHPITQRCYVDVELDGTVIERWTVDSLLPGQSTDAAKDWTGLMQADVRLSGGTHQVRLLVDSTHLLTQDGGSQTVITTTFDWPDYSASQSAPRIVPAKLPNLVPTTPEGWTGPILLYSRDSMGITRLPSLDVPMYLRTAVRNIGLSSVTQPFAIHVFVDGLLVARYKENGLVANGQVLTPEWDGLFDVVHLQPGWHQATVIVDPQQDLLEQRTQDNIFTTEFFLRTGLTPQLRAPTTSVSLGRPEVLPFVPPQWDGAIVATNLAGVFTAPNVLDSANRVLIHWAVKNGSRTQPTSPYSVALRLDGETVNEWSRPALVPGGIDVVLDSPLVYKGTSRFTGTHRLTLEVSPAFGGNAQAQPATSVFREFVWGKPLVPALSQQYTDEAIAARLAKLPALLDSTAALSSSSQATKDVLDILDSVYYVVYKRSLYEEDVSIHLLDQQDFETWVKIECADLASIVTPTQRMPYSTACGRLGREDGFQGPWRSHQRIVVRADRPPVQVLATLAHEVGHFRQELLRPDLDAAAGSFSFSTLREAQAYAHEVYFLRALENLTGISMMRYPKTEAYERYMDKWLSDTVSDSNTDEHARGLLLFWMVLFAEPGVRQQRVELFENNRISEQAARGTLQYLFAFAPQDVDRYVTARLSDFSTYYPTLQTLLRNRLVPGLPYWEEGSPYLREIGLFFP